jgi:alkylation response protein AidB-like acyl-CoA dehydrogenase
MDLMPDGDLLEIERTVAAWLTAKLPVQGRGRDHVIVGPEIDPALWSEVAELGWLALGLPEAAAGAGCSVVEEAVLFRELGRAVAPGPFLPTVLAAHVACAAGDVALTSALAAGNRRVALGTAAGALSIGDTVTGPLSITHARAADLVFVCDANGAALLRADDLAITEIDAVDGTVPVGVATADAVAAVARVDGPAIRDRGLVLAAATGVGLAMGVLAAGASYATQRQQFGKAIGAFQAVKHPLADAAVRADSADAQIAYAAIAVRDGLTGASSEAVVAKWAADDAARRNAEAVVQAHGAMGFTAEATPYRYVLRAHVLGRTLALRGELLDEILPA